MHCVAEEEGEFGIDSNIVFIFIIYGYDCVVASEEIWIYIGEINHDKRELPPSCHTSLDLITLMFM